MKATLKPPNSLKDKEYSSSDEKDERYNTTNRLKKNVIVPVVSLPNGYLNNNDSITKDLDKKTVKIPARKSIQPVALDTDHRVSGPLEVLDHDPSDRSSSKYVTNKLTS
jgi:hypothetical protein